MQILIRAVITGFGLSIGAALYKKVARQLGLEEPEEPAGRDKPPETVERGGAQPVTES
jgi:hypothetical protein